jgi:hypothetical protein
MALLTLSSLLNDVLNLGVELTGALNKTLDFTDSEFQAMVAAAQSALPGGSGVSVVLVSEVPIFLPALTATTFNDSASLPSKQINVSGTTPSFRLVSPAGRHMACISTRPGLPASRIT